MHNFPSLCCSTLNASTASAGFGMVPQANLICTPDLMGHVFMTGQLVSRSIHAHGQFTLLVPEPPSYPSQRLCKPDLLALPADPRFISMRSSSPAPPGLAPPPPALVHASSPSSA
jgi:hypothetical protein